MSVRLHLVRHAQGFHNLNTANHSLPDPDLTPLGEAQCATLSTVFPAAFPQSGAPKITHLVASPLRRTLYTCILSFPAEVQRGLVITALPELQETSAEPCDTGSEPAKIIEEFGSKVDFRLVKPGWNSKKGKWSPASSALRTRAQEARVFLRNMAQEAQRAAAAGAEKNVDIVVVTHGGYLHHFTEDWSDYTDTMGTGWANTEFRSYEFVDVNGGDERASVVETGESRERRKGTEKTLSADEKRELKASVEAEESEKELINGEAKL
jgi:broad specificity phosphatase PhoE